MTNQVASLSDHRIKKGDSMLAQWRMWQMAQGLSTRTIDERQRTMRQLVEHANTTLDLITPEHIIEFVARPDLSQSSRASYHATIRAFYKWATLTGNIADNPAVATPSPKRPKGLPRPVQTAHISVILKHANRKRTRAMIILAAYAGLRAHEIAKFHGRDLDPIGGIITVTGKGGKTAMIPAHPAVIELATEMPTLGFWFPAYAHQTDRPHIDSKAVTRAVGKTMRRAGVNATAHQLRHWYASTLLDEGVDVRVVKELMRHESIATTEIYTQVSMKKMFEGVAQLPMAA